jgi:hypothetical protein
MNNRVMKNEKESDVKYIKKVTAEKTKTAQTAKTTAENKTPAKVFGMPCLPQTAD